LETVFAGKERCVVSRWKKSLIPRKSAHEICALWKMRNSTSFPVEFLIAASSAPTRTFLGWTLSEDQISAEAAKPEKKELLPGDYRLGPLLFLLGVILVLAIGGWLGFKVYKSLHSDPQPVNAATSQPSVNPGPAQTSQSEPVLGTTETGPINVALHLKQKSWISVNSDGKATLADNFDEGTEQQFSAQKTMKLVIGNGAAVDLSYNGKPIALRTAQGQAVTLSFTPEGYTVVR
jgi:hypothetical protein